MHRCLHGPQLWVGRNHQDVQKTPRMCIRYPAVLHHYHWKTRQLNSKHSKNWRSGFGVVALTAAYLHFLRKIPAYGGQNRVHFFRTHIFRALSGIRDTDHWSLPRCFWHPARIGTGMIANSCEFQSQRKTKPCVSVYFVMHSMFSPHLWKRCVKTHLLVMFLTIDTFFSNICYEFPDHIIS